MACCQLVIGPIGVVVVMINVAFVVVVTTAAQNDVLGHVTSETPSAWLNWTKRQWDAGPVGSFVMKKPAPYWLEMAHSDGPPQDTDVG